MFDISTRKSPDSISFTVTIKEVVHTFEYEKNYLISKTRDEVLSQVKEELASKSIGRHYFFKILNHINFSITEYLRGYEKN